MMSLSNSYTRARIPSNVPSYLHNFALGYLSQRSTSEKHLEFVLRRRIAALQLRSSAKKRFYASKRGKSSNTNHHNLNIQTASAAAPPSTSRSDDIFASGDSSAAISSQLIDEAIQKILAHFRGIGVLNDEAYAMKRVSLLRHQCRSRRYIQMYLMKKGISNELIEKTLAQVDADSLTQHTSNEKPDSDVKTNQDDDDFDGDELISDDLQESDRQSKIEEINDEIESVDEVAAVSRIHQFRSTSSSEEADFFAALALARKRKLGPFNVNNHPKLADRQRNLEKLARAGFSFQIAKRVLALPSEMARSYFERPNGDQS